MFRFFILSLFIAYGCLLCGQNPYTLTKQYTIENGLPSNECHDIVQDSLGYIWIATDRGLSRFDGYGFKTYGPKEGLGDLSCLDIYLDRYNNIWISTLSKKVYKYISKIDTIVPYEFNHLLKPFTADAMFSYLYDLDECDDTYFGVPTRGIIKITSNGSIILPDTNIINSNEYYSHEIEGKHFLGVGSGLLTGKKTQLNVGTFIFDSYINHYGFIIPVVLDLNQREFVAAKSYKYGNSNYVYCLAGHRYFFKSNKLLKIIKGSDINDILTFKNGEILSAQIFKKGVKLYKNSDAFLNEKSVPFMDNISASRLFKDDQENIFITTLEDGFYFLQKKMIKQVDLGKYSHNAITKIQRKDNNSLLILLDENTIIEKRLNQKKN